MKKPSKWIKANDTFIALDGEGVMVGYIKHVKASFKPPNRTIETL